MEVGLVSVPLLARQALGDAVGGQGLRPATDGWVERQGMDWQSVTGPRASTNAVGLGELARHSVGHTTAARKEHVLTGQRNCSSTNGLWIGHSLARPIRVNPKNLANFKTLAAFNPFTFSARTVASDEMSCETLRNSAIVGPVGALSTEPQVLLRVGSCDDLAGRQPSNAPSLFKYRCTWAAPSLVSQPGTQHSTPPCTTSHLLFPPPPPGKCQTPTPFSYFSQLKLEPCECHSHSHLELDYRIKLCFISPLWKAIMSSLKSHCPAQNTPGH